jgi:hypothetical protein
MKKKKRIQLGSDIVYQSVVSRIGSFFFRKGDTFFLFETHFLFCMTSHWPMVTKRTTYIFFPCHRGACGDSEAVEEDSVASLPSSISGVVLAAMVAMMMI